MTAPLKPVPLTSTPLHPAPQTSAPQTSAPQTSAPLALPPLALPPSVLPPLALPPQTSAPLASAAPPATSLTSASFDVLAGLLKSTSGLTIGQDKIYLLETRLGGIVKRERLADLNALADRLRRPRTDSLARDVVEAMTTNESFFFRDDKPFLHFRNHALPRITAARPANGPIRIWSAAASSGQEAYSLAMIIAESKAVLSEHRVEIIGTDIAREQLNRAREGLYSQFEVQRGLPVQMLMRWFRKEDANWRIHEQLRGMVTFREFNLLSDPRVLGQFDIVFCRNVLIYFDQPTKSRVLEAIAGNMPPDGLLYLGGAETVLGITARFAPLPGERGVYGLASATGSQPAAGRVHALV